MNQLKSESVELLQKILVSTFEDKYLVTNLVQSRYKDLIPHDVESFYYYEFDGVLKYLSSFEVVEAYKRSSWFLGFEWDSVVYDEYIRGKITSYYNEENDPITASLLQKKYLQVESCSYLENKLGGQYSILIDIVLAKEFINANSPSVPHFDEKTGKFSYLGHTFIFKARQDTKIQRALSLFCSRYNSIIKDKEFFEEVYIGETYKENHDQKDKMDRIFKRIKAELKDNKVLQEKIIFIDTPNGFLMLLDKKYL